MIETLVNEVLLDEREPGSFDPVAAMRRRLSDDLVKSRFHILELERHRTRIRQHMDRLARRHGADVLGSMLRAAASRSPRRSARPMRRSRRSSRPMPCSTAIATTWSRRPPAGPRPRADR